jgi:hypothetical protein
MPTISGGTSALPGQMLFEEVTFTETSGSGVYTGSVTVPANAWLIDIKLYNTVYWDNAGTIVMKVGDAVDDDGWYTGVNLKATDIVAGADAEVIDFDNPGGQEGAYLVTATGERALMYSALVRVISGIVTTSSTGGTAGRTRMLVIWSTTDTPIVATKV